MITCTECKKEYSAQASACVHCGARNPNRMTAGAKFGVFLLLVVGLFVVLLVIGGVSNQATGGRVSKAEMCSQSAEAAHYIAALSADSDDVVRVTNQVIANRKYPLLGDKVVASIGAVVAIGRSIKTPDEISEQVRNSCEQNVQQ